MFKVETPTIRTDKLIKTALMFPANSFSAICVSDRDRTKIKIEEIKDDVLQYIRIKKTPTLFEILDEFDIGINELAQVLKQLESERKIKLNDLT